jgi:hypothetical protein
MSGVPYDWAATVDRPGLNLLENISEDAAHRVRSEIHTLRQSDDISSSYRFIEAAIGDMRFPTRRSNLLTHH